MTDSTAKATRTPEGARLYAVGDLHGQLDLLEALRIRIETDLETSPCDSATVVFVGDYVDRGPDSAGIIEFLISTPIGACDRVCLKGNHEAMLLDFLDDPETGSLWLRNGGMATMRSYGVVPESDFDLRAVRLALLDAIPATHIEFLDSLSLHHRAGDYLFVHAGLRPGVPLDQQSEDDLMWIRKDFHAAGDVFDHYIVHGHTPVPEPLILPHRADIDTGAFAYGRLTCLVLDGTEKRVIQVADD